jgi:hypothetical protein
MWFLLLLPILAFSQGEIDLSAVQNLEEILPDNDIPRDAYRNIPFEKKNRGFQPLVKKIGLEEILSSGTTYSYLKSGTTIYRISDNKPFITTKEMYLQMFRLQDEQGFRYLENNNQKCTYKVTSDNITRIGDTIALYEPPMRFTSAPENIIRTEYDRKLKLASEAAFYVGLVQSRYIRDLFNDPEARSGETNQYAFHLFTDWKLPVKVGGSVHYERSSFNLSGNGLVFYEALSIGPQFRTQDFELFETNWRLSTQIRVSPFAKLRGETVNGNVNFKFNSTDLMSSLEHPWSNRFGQFVIGGFHQIQWLNIKDQPEIVSLRASNQTNQSFGLFLSQVFQ